MSTLDAPLTAKEKREQLRRILASQRFRNAPNPSAFLKLVVTRALKGLKSPTRVIAAELFKGKYAANISTDVRVTASNLRASLDKYYEFEGNDDPVIISFPKTSGDKRVKPPEGEAYTPLFTPNPNLYLALRQRLGHYHLERRAYGDFVRSFNIFAEILESDPKHLGASLGLIETLSAFADRSWENPHQIPWYPFSLDVLNQLEARAGDYWKVWAVRGLVQTTWGHLYEARPAFDKALLLDRSRTMAYPPYMLFLAKAGHRDEAVRLAFRYLNANAERSEAHVFYAYLLIELQAFDKAAQTLEIALSIDSGNGVAHEFLTYLGYLRRDLESVSTHLKILKTLFDPESYQKTAEFLLKMQEGLGIGDSPTPALFGEASAPFSEMKKLG